MKPYRKEKLASTIQQVISEKIAFHLNDPRISPMTTVTRVELTGDLLLAKVFLSVLGSDAEESRTLAAIQHAGGLIQRHVASEVRMRQCPRLDFRIDESVKVARQTMALLDQNRRENPALADGIEADGIEADEIVVDGIEADGIDAEVHDTDAQEPPADDAPQDGQAVARRPSRDNDATEEGAA